MANGLATSNIERVYSGQLSRCCCGCSGKYYENDGSAGSLKMMCKIISLMYEAKLIKTVMGSASTIRLDETEDYWALETKTRLYIIYFKANAVRKEMPVKSKKIHNTISLTDRIN